MAVAVQRPRVSGEGDVPGIPENELAQRENDPTGHHAHVSRTRLLQGERRAGAGKLV